MGTKTIVNIHAGPGAGKSTLAAGLFSRLKTLDVKCELVTEYAKEMVYSRRNGEMSNQLYITAKQNKRIDDIFLYDPSITVITDSPLMLGCFYGKEAPYFEELKNLILAINNNYNNINVFVNRVKKYQTYGRNQNEEDARQIDHFVKNKLGIDFDFIVDGSPEGVDILAPQIKDAIETAAKAEQWLKNTNQ